jgi:hypothetical protein
MLPASAQAGVGDQVPAGRPEAISFHSMHRSLHKLTTATVFTALADHMTGACREVVVVVSD